MFPQGSRESLSPIFSISYRNCTYMIRLYLLTKKKQQCSLLSGEMVNDPVAFMQIRRSDLQSLTEIHAVCSL